MADIKQIARSIAEDIYGAGKLELFDSYCAPGYTYHDPLAGDLDVDGEKDFVRALHSAFPDLQMTVEKCFAEDNDVCVQWRCTGTHQGSFMGFPGSGRRMDIRGIDIVSFEANQVKDVFTHVDSLGLMQQLGIVPQLGRAPTPPAEEARPS